MGVALALALLLACSGSKEQAKVEQPSPSVVEVIEAPAQLAGQVGRVVTLHGTVENSKIASLLGVDVASDDPDLRGQQAWATGRLEQHEEEDPMKDGVIRAGRAAGTYLRLVDPATGRLAQVRATR